MRHYTFTRVVFECEADNTDEAIAKLAQATGITYKPWDDLCITNVPHEVHWWEGVAS